MSLKGAYARLRRSQEVEPDRDCDACAIAERCVGEYDLACSFERQHEVARLTSFPCGKQYDPPQVVLRLCGGRDGGALR